MTASIPILLYHHVSPDREMTPDAFRRQLTALLERGYRSMSMDEVYKAVSGLAAVPERAFALTFDDGYLDNWLFAFPVLRELNVAATLYLVTAAVETTPTPRTADRAIDTRTRERSPGSFVSWQEARRMVDSNLVTIGSHTHTHRAWVRGQRYADLQDELTRSKALIEENVGRPCYHLAWPWGEYENTWWPLVTQAGYQTVVTVRSGANRPGTPAFALQRINVTRSSADWLLRRLQWHRYAAAAEAFGWVYGLDRRLKVWWQHESPYSHG